MSVRTIIIKPGEKVLLPQGTKVDSIVATGGISVSSTCDNLPAPVARQCYKIKWEFTAGDQWLGVLFGGVTYMAAEGNNSIFGLVQFLAANTDLSHMISTYCPADDGTVGELFLAMPESLGATFELIVNKQIGSGDFKYYIHAEPQSDCTDCNNNI